LSFCIFIVQIFMVLFFFSKFRDLLIVILLRFYISPLFLSRNRPEVFWCDWIFDRQFDKIGWLATFSFSFQPQLIVVAVSPLNSFVCHGHFTWVGTNENRTFCLGWFFSAMSFQAMIFFFCLLCVHFTVEFSGLDFKKEV
jgi:hypothetical protein